MTPDLVATYIPCFWCGKVAVWYGIGGTPYRIGGKPQVPSMGRMCHCQERHEAMVEAGIEREANARRIPA